MSLNVLVCVDIRDRGHGPVCYKHEIVEVDLTPINEYPEHDVSAYMATFTGAFIFVGLFYILGMKIRTVLKIFK